MPKPSIYLDNAATTAMRPEVVEAMLPFLTGNYGNPSSLHQAGKNAARALNQARSEVVSLLGATPDDLIFTSGGTESNNLALKGIAFGLQKKGKHIITSKIEHPSVLEPLEWLIKQGWQVTYLPVDAEGFVNPADVKMAISAKTTLISVMHGNNEVGSLQPIEEIGQIARKHGILFHTDAVQTVGKLPINLAELPVDLLSASGHKLHGPKGVGLLYASENAREAMVSLNQGGGQQQDLRSGTENVAGIVGFTRALAFAMADLSVTTPQMKLLQQMLMDGIRQQVPLAKLNGPEDLSRRVPGNLNFSFAPVEGEALVLRMDLKGICVSSGSACHSAQLEGSHVLQAMQCTDEEAKSSLRFSIGRETTAEEIRAVLDALPVVLEKAGFFRHQTPSLLQ